MTVVAVGFSDVRNGVEAARQAALQAREALDGRRAALAIVFASADYGDLARIPGVVMTSLDGSPTIGGTAGGCIWGSHRIAHVGVTVIAVGGDDIIAATTSVPIASPDLSEIVWPAKRLAVELDTAKRADLECLGGLVFGPGLLVDGEALAAATRKGLGESAQLAGGLTGRSDYRTEQAHVFCDAESSSDRVALAAIRTRRPLGICAKHGWKPCGPLRVVTETSGTWVREIDHRRAFDVWMEDALAAGAAPPPGRDHDVVLYLATHYELGMVPRGEVDIVVRAPFEIDVAGAVRLSGSVPEGARVRLTHRSREDILNAARVAATEAARAVDGKPAGALVLACSGLHGAPGRLFPSEPSMIADIIGAPTGGACVFGEIVRALREADAFHNTSSVVLAFPGDDT